MAEPRRAPLWLLILLALATATAAFWYRENPLNDTARQEARDVAVLSAGVYITLRTVNAFLSAAQEAEVGGAFVVSGSIQPLKTLEPIDDTIERIAGIVFAVLVVTGLLSVAMGPVSALGAGMMSLALLLWVADRLIGRQDVVVTLARRLLWYGLFLAIAVPAAFALSGNLSERMAGSVWTENEAVIEDIIDPLGAPGAEGGSGPIDTINEYREMAGNIVGRADELIGSYINLLAVFLFRVLLLPALLMGGFFVTIRFFAHRP